MKPVAFNSLELVYCPLSNQEADWLWNDGAIRPLVAESKLYMIGQRKQLFFSNIDFDPKTGIFHFDLECGDSAARGLEYDPSNDLQGISSPVKFEAGEKIYRIRDAATGEIIRWFTPDRLLWEHWKEIICVRNLADVRIFTTFDLHYVGISTENDSFSRLFKNGHEKRAKILSNERQKELDQRLTDELFIFLFVAKDLLIKTYDPTEEEEDDTPDYLDPKRLHADAEKAFVKILQSKYNSEKYDKYPECVDGLYKEGLRKYGYYLLDPLTFVTETDKIVGANPFNFGKGRQPDYIAIAGDKVNLMRGG